MNKSQLAIVIFVLKFGKFKKNKVRAKRNIEDESNQIRIPYFLFESTHILLLCTFCSSCLWNRERPNFQKYAIPTQYVGTRIPRNLVGIRKTVTLAKAI